MYLIYLLETNVRVTDLRVYAKVIKLLEEPRSYLIQSNTRSYRKNRWHLIPTPYYKELKFIPT